MARLVVIGALVLGFVLSGCADEGGQGGPSGEDLKAERARVASKMKGKKGRKAAKKASESEKTAQPARRSFASVDKAYSYVPAGRRDPFEPYRVDKSSTEEEAGGPLEQFELQQVNVVAIIWSANRPRAMVTDPSGATYVVHVGSRMGKNQGRVIHIGDNLVLVKETYVDYAGEESTKDVELRIRTSQGG